MIKYFILEGQFVTIHRYNFPILNHLRHNKLVSYPLFLFSSLDKCSFKDFYPPLYKGFIYTIYNYCLDKTPLSTPLHRIILLMIMTRSLLILVVPKGKFPLKMKDASLSHAILFGCLMVWGHSLLNLIKNNQKPQKIEETSMQALEKLRFI